MSSIESRADENSNRLNIGTSRDSTEGTVDRLNEAPQLIQRLIAAARPFLDPDIVDETTGTVGLMDELEAAISAAESLLRDE